MTDTSKPLLAALGLAEKLLATVAARVLPWSNRSQHDAYVHGYRDGLRDGTARS